MLMQIQDSTDEASAALRAHQCIQLHCFAQPLPCAEMLVIDELVERLLLTPVEIRSPFHHVDPSFLTFVILVYHNIWKKSRQVAQQRCLLFVQNNYTRLRILLLQFFQMLWYRKA